MLEVILGIILVLSIGFSLRLYSQMSALKNLQYRESLERMGIARSLREFVILY